MRIKSFVKGASYAAFIALGSSNMFSQGMPTIGSITGGGEGYSTSQSTPDFVMPDISPLVYGTGDVQNANNNMELGKIKGDTAAILDNLSKIQQDTQKMREIEMARQQLTQALNAINELTTQGNVFAEDPFANAIANNGVPNVSALDNYAGGGGGSSSMGSMQGAANSMPQIFSQLGNQMKAPDSLGGVGGLGLGGTTANSMIQNAEGYGTQFLSAQLASGASKLNIPGASSLGAGLFQGLVQKLFGLSYQGIGGQYGFTGAGADYTQNLIGNGGRVVASDYVPPVVQTPITKYQEASLSSLLASHLRENYRVCSINGKNPFEVAPGLFVHPKTEADVLFEKMVLHGTPGSEVAFYAAASAYGGSQYNPKYGFSKSASLPMPVNFNDVLSRGAYGAVNRYNQENGVDPKNNAYGLFARSIAPIIQQVVDSTPPGAKVCITPSDVERASKSTSITMSGAPVKDSDWRAMFARSKNKEAEYVRAAIAGATSFDTPVTAYSGLTEQETNEYSAKQGASSTRIDQNNKALMTVSLLLGYNKKALDAVSRLNQRLEQLRQQGANNPSSSLDIIPAMQQNSQNTMLVLQNRIGQCHLNVEDLLKSRDDELKSREATREKYRDMISARAKSQIQEAALMTKTVGF